MPISRVRDTPIKSPDGKVHTPIPTSPTQPSLTKVSSLETTSWLPMTISSFVYRAGSGLASCSIRRLSSRGEDGYVWVMRRSCTRSQALGEKALLTTLQEVSPPGQICSAVKTWQRATINVGLSAESWLAMLQCPRSHTRIMTTGRDRDKRLERSCFARRPHSRLVLLLPMMFFTCIFLRG